MASASMLRATTKLLPLSPWMGLGVVAAMWREARHTEGLIDSALVW